MVAPARQLASGRRTRRERWILRHGARPIRCVGLGHGARLDEPASSTSGRWRCRGRWRTWPARDCAFCRSRRAVGWAEVEARVLAWGPLPYGPPEEADAGRPYRPASVVHARGRRACRPCGDYVRRFGDGGGPTLWYLREVPAILARLDAAALARRGR